MLSLLVMFLSTALMVMLLRHYALRRNLVDIPNHRSSHARPTPTGGGMAIVICFSVALMIAPFYLNIPVSYILGLLFSGLFVALIGFLDDCGHVPAHRRLIVHIVSAVIFLVVVGGIPEIILLGYQVDLKWYGWPIAAFYLVWSLNLYNFMDGIDGIAGAEGVSVAAAASLLSYLLCPEQDFWLLPLFLSVSTAGFLIWNFPQAKIFMGDAGSGYLGITLGGLSILSYYCAQQLLWSWLVLLGVFIVDATFTILRRLIAGERIYQAHRSHAYQRAYRRFGNRKVTFSVVVINLIWLFPIAYAIAFSHLDGMVGILLAYTPLIVMVAIFKAGSKQDEIHISS